VAGFFYVSMSLSCISVLLLGVKAALALLPKQVCQEGNYLLLRTAARLSSFFQKAKKLALKGGPPVHGRRSQCRSPLCKSPLVVLRIISMMM
jgi:hypothetical protein